MKIDGWMVAFALVAQGCSEAREQVVDVGDTAADAVTTMDAPSGVDAGASSDAGARTEAGTPTDVGAGGLVVNEIRAAGDDWVELFNAGSSAFDLGGYTLADLDPDAGTPRLSGVVRFPAGTMLVPGGYLFVLAGVADAGVGPQSQCLAGGPSPCFHASWSISASRGETVSVLDPTGRVVARGLYPADAVPSGQTWGRLPNGAGELVPNRPTPGAANQEP
ncbi:MAG: lamin tail domain-containing protein [Deltaproteobacteria bacterium]|nr:lamin tail domain-containing protein [Deltaproteobacteria bacterium]